MLSLTKKTDYALIALSHLARRGTLTTSAREVAQASRVPLPILTNILKTLAHAGVVASERGASGGYRMAKPTSAITLQELIRTIEGPIAFVQCVHEGGETHGESCELTPCCPIRLPAKRIHDRLHDFLQGVTLADLMEDSSTDVGIALRFDAERNVPNGNQTREFAR